MRLADLWPKIRGDVWMAAILAVLVWAWVDTRTSLNRIKELVDTRSEFRWQTTSTLDHLHKQLERIQSRLASAEGHLGDR